MKENNILLQVSRLKKYFLVNKGFLKKETNFLKAVDDVSFSIERGSIMGLIGESGCGKSTMAKTILRLESPTGGSVKYKGNSVFDVDKNLYMSNKEMFDLRRKMQIVFQDSYSSLDPKQNILTILKEGALKHKVIPANKAKEYCEKMVELCGLEVNDLYKYPHEFSGGQRQRIGIARALSVQPEFIICDEPTAALDVSIQSQILNLMLDLKKNLNLTYLFISHNIEVVKHLCDKIGVMYLGNIVEIADTKNICGTPLHPYTKMLLSSVPISTPWEKRERNYFGENFSIILDYSDGCKFRTRCKYAHVKCKKEVPGPVEVERGHFVSCHLYE